MPDVFVAVISGRSVTNVKEMVGIEGITYAGNHGLEIIHPDGTRFTHPMPAEMEGKVGVLLEQLQQECCKVTITMRKNISSSEIIRTEPGLRTRVSF